MSDGRADLVNPRRRLPELALPSADGAPVPLRAPGRRSPLIVLAHGGDCAACAVFVRRLEAERAEIEAWDGRVLLVAPGSTGAEPSIRSDAFPVLIDGDGRVAKALSVHPPAVVVADPWGEIHEAREGGEAHRLPSPEEIVGWLRYLAIQCPECQGEAF